MKFCWVSFDLDPIKLIIIVIIDRMTIVSEDQWGDLECMYIACQAAIELMEAYSQTLLGR